MKSFKRTLTVILLVVAAFTALRAPAFANDGQLRLSAQACHCHEGCAPNTDTCKEQGSCTAICGGNILAADIGFAMLVPGVAQRAAHGHIARLDSLTHPPPLQPPRA